MKGTAPIIAIANNVASIPTEFVLGIFVLALFGNLWEETSWSGFVTNRLQARFGPLKASLIVAPLFGLYHLPLFFIIAGLDSGPNHLPLAQFPLYLAFLLIVFSGPMRILLTWIYNSTGQSLPVVSLFHASINATGGVAILATYLRGRRRPAPLRRPCRDGRSSSSLGPADDSDCRRPLAWTCDQRALYSQS